MGCCSSSIHSVATPLNRGQNRPIPYNSTKSQPKQSSRLITSYSLDNFEDATHQPSKSGPQPAYTCPICTLRFHSTIRFVTLEILACDHCNNCICLKCYLAYQKKSQKNFRCSFCGSDTSLFKDYEKEPHSYFDMTGNGGFLPLGERRKINEEMNMAIGTGRLHTISEIGS